MNTTELKAVKAEFKAYLKAHRNTPQSLSSAMQQVVCAIDTALANSHAPEFTNEWLREARRNFEAANLTRGKQP